MNKYQEALDELFRYATHNDNGEKGVNDYILKELTEHKETLQELMIKTYKGYDIEKLEFMYSMLVKNYITPEMLDERVGLIKLGAEMAVKEYNNVIKNFWENKTYWDKGEKK